MPVTLLIQKVYRDDRSFFGRMNQLDFDLDVPRDQVTRAFGYRLNVDWDGEICVIKGSDVEVRGHSISNALERWIIAVNRKLGPVQFEAELRGEK